MNAQSNSFIEAASHKIRRQIHDLERVSGTLTTSLTVDGVPVDSYLTRFVWDEARYPTMSPLWQIVDGIMYQLLKLKMILRCEFLSITMCAVNSMPLTESRPEGMPCLAVRDLSNIVKPQDLITSEHLVTLLAIVPKYSQKDWLSCCETLTTYVVPRFSKLLHEDNEYALYTVTVFNRGADNFRSKESRKQELEKLMQEQDSLRNSLLQWCYTSYGEVFTAWMHFCAVRVFAESILRYGLPPTFLSVVRSPSIKSEKKVCSLLETLSDTSNSTYWKTEDEVGMGGFGGDADSYPYVSPSP